MSKKKLGLVDEHLTELDYEEIQKDMLVGRYVGGAIACFAGLFLLILMVVLLFG